MHSSEDDAPTTNPTGAFLYGSTYGEADSPHSSGSSSSDSQLSDDDEIDEADLMRLLGKKHSAYKKLKKSIKRNRRKGLDTSRKSKSDSLAIHCLNQLHRSGADHKPQSKVRMGEYFDRPYSATHCVKRDLAITWHPYLALALAEAFLRCGPRSKKLAADALDLQVALALHEVWKLLRYREGMAVTERVFDIIDEEDMRPKRFIERLKGLHQVMGSDTLLSHDSVLCHRAPNTCYSHGMISLRQLATNHHDSVRTAIVNQSARLGSLQPIATIRFGCNQSARFGSFFEKFATTQGASVSHAHPYLESLD